MYKTILDRWHILIIVFILSKTNSNYFIKDLIPNFVDEIFSFCSLKKHLLYLNIERINDSTDM